MPKSFADLGLPEELIADLDSRGIKEPFAIQEATITDSLDGHDVCGRAPTGSGKTLAFSIPMVLSVDRARPRHPRGLVLVPTRELAAQVEAVVTPLAKVYELRVMSIYGGIGFEPQMKTIRRGVDIVVATPGRLLDLIERGALSLEDVDFVVIDEADRMADMGFLPDVKRILDQTNEDRQTLLFSATLDGDVDVLIKRYQYEPVKHEVVRPEDEEDNTLHLFWKVDRHNRVSIVKDILQRVGPTIVFTRTKHGAERLAQQLEREKVTVAPIHGGRSQPQRDRALAAFSAGRVQVLVATDVAARGIHVDEVQCVIHFDVPDDHKTYVHRSGRTARAGLSGIVVSLVQPDQARQVTQMQRQLEMMAGVIDPNYKALPEIQSDRPAYTGDSVGREKADTGQGGGDGTSAGRRRNRNRRRPGSASGEAQKRPNSEGQGGGGGGGNRPRSRNRGRGRPAA